MRKATFTKIHSIQRYDLPRQLAEDLRYVNTSWPMIFVISERHYDPVLVKLNEWLLAHGAHQNEEIVIR